MIEFLLEDEKAPKNDRIDFFDYFAKFLEIFLNDGCNQANLTKIISEI